MGRRAYSATGLRRRGRLLLCSSTVMVVLIAAGLRWLRRDPADHMLARYGQLADVVEGPLTRVAGGLVDRDVRITSKSGLAVDLLVRRPENLGTAPRPAMLVLGGIRTGRKSAQLVPDTHGFVIAGVSYPTHLTRIGRLSEVFEARRALIDTPPALMLGVDYLRSLPFVDPERIELVGVSLGAPMVCVAGALDQRVCRIWSMYGGAAPMRIFEQGLKKDIRNAWLRRPAAWCITALSDGFTLAPETWVERISPRPFLMVNASGDERIPLECVELLFASAADPKELIWIEGGHLDKHDQTEVARLIELVVSHPAPR